MMAQKIRRRLEGAKHKYALRRMKKLINFEELKKEWMKDPLFKKTYKDLEFEYEIALELIKARLHSKMTQREVAARVGTTQSVIARLESSRMIPGIKKGS